MRKNDFISYKMSKQETINYLRNALIVYPRFKSNDAREEMIKERENIHNLIVQYLKANEYNIKYRKIKKF